MQLYVFGYHFADFAFPVQALVLYQLSYLTLLQEDSYCSGLRCDVICSYFCLSACNKIRMCVCVCALAAAPAS